MNKIKLLEALDEDDEEEEKPRRSSSRLRHTARASKRTAVIQSSSDSDRESSIKGKQMLFLVLFKMHKIQKEKYTRGNNRYFADVNSAVCIFMFQAAMG